MRLKLLVLDQRGNVARKGGHDAQKDACGQAGANEPALLDPLTRPSERDGLEPALPARASHPHPSLSSNPTPAHTQSTMSSMEVDEATIECVRSVCLGAEADA